MRTYIFYCRRRGAIGDFHKSIRVRAATRVEAWVEFSSTYGDDWEPGRFGGAFREER